MARQLICDRCHNTAPDTEEGRREWTHITLSKMASQATFIPQTLQRLSSQSEDLCDTCTGVLRKFLQNSSL